MKRIASFALLFACSPFVIAQTGTSQDGPLISIYLPHGMRSDKVQVEYFMTGPFGGYGIFVGPEPDHQTVDFRAAVNGKPADRIKGIAYLPGCELVVLDFPVAGTAMWRQLDCKPVPMVTLHGRVPSAFVGRKTEVAASYEADWAFDFYGIADGLATVFNLARSVPDQNGEFTLVVPNFYLQNLGHGSYALDLRCRNCDDLAGPGVIGQTRRELSVAASYPLMIEFTAQ